jgi:hypothetical protein
VVRDGCRGGGGRFNNVVLGTKNRVCGLTFVRVHMAYIKTLVQCLWSNFDSTC